ncbi:MAG: glycosyltransferase family 39 protein [Chitinophagales bacterium]|nr:glycosyltransferase family 39 protein [Bacteroidota bacterium]MBK8683287.1 glycosyltransferase family 39 protein [Bacteroidota bacterium]MBP9548655.1 glycosyltransferase family 39 protein [Chitinophagales bacterium]
MLSLTAVKSYFSKQISNPFFYAVCAALLFLPFLGHVHLFDWDEINFAEISREMLVLDNYLQVHVRFLPFWEKPPLFFWLQACCMQLFGVNEFAARLTNALCGIITLPVLFCIGKKLYDEKFGFFWALIYAGTLLPTLYFQTGIIDPIFNLFMFLGIYFFILFTWKKKNETNIELVHSALYYLFFAGLFTGLAMLTKGPAAFIILGLCYFVYWVIVKFKWYISVPQFLFYTLIAFSLSAIWYGIETLMHGSYFITKFFEYNFRLFSTEEAGHAGFPGYHFVVVFLGCFPASLFLFKGLFKQEHALSYRKNFKTWMLILFWSVLLLFSLVNTKIVHYSSMTYFPLTFIAALTLYEMYKQKTVLRKDIFWSIRILSIVIGVALIALPIIGLNIEWLQNKTQDVFAKANMNAEVSWTGIESIIGVLFIISAFVGTALMRNGNIMKGSVILFISTAIVFKLAMIVYVPNIEKYSQGAAIEFYESISDEDVYLQPIGFKTYAPLFYAKLLPQNAPKVSDYSDKKQVAEWEKWLLNGAIDKPAYFITRIDKKNTLESNPKLNLLMNKNGFLVYKRMPE